MKNGTAIHRSCLYFRKRGRCAGGHRYGKAGRGSPEGTVLYVCGTSASRSGRMRRVVAAGRFAPARRRKPAGGGQFSQRPRLCGGLSRQMLLNYGFSAAAVSVCRLFTAAASANRLFAKTALYARFTEDAFTRLFFTADACARLSFTGLGFVRRPVCRSGAAGPFRARG